MHARPLQRTQQLDLQIHAPAGLPTCQRCLTPFSSWHRFRIHVESHACQVRPSFDAPPSPEIDPDLEAGLLRNSNLRVQDLAFLNGREAGRSFLRHIIEKDWDGLALDQPACALLRTRCGLCGAYQSRMQDLSRHLKQHHRSRADGIAGFAAQLADQQLEAGYCQYCESSWTSRHKCPVLMQAALFSIHGAPTMDDDGGPLPSLSCLHCTASFTSAQELHAHIQACHRTGCYDWDPQRDALHSDGLACAHCNATFVAPDGLRQHITNGRCPSFDPHGHRGGTPLSTVWIAHLQNGTFPEFISQDEHKTDWSRRCLICGTSYNRTQDVAAHLQLQHAELWEEARPYLTFLLETLGPALGCVCVPMIRQARSAHLCTPMIQAAMILARNRETFLLPFDIKPEHWTPCWTTPMPQPIQQLLKKLLQTRDFCRFWLDNTLMTYLQTHCCWCEVTTPHAALMHVHLLEAHFSRHRGVGSLLDVLTNLLFTTMDESYECHLCGQVFALPSSTVDVRRPLAQAHLRAQCPVLLQAALLLTAAHDRDGGPSCPGGQSQPILGSPLSSGLCTTPRHTGGNARQGQAPKRRRTLGPGHQEDERSTCPPRSLGHWFRPLSTSPADLDLTSDQDGPGPCTSTPSRSVPLLHDPRRSGDSDQTSSKRTEMERPTESVDTPGTLEMPPCLSHADGTLGESHQTVPDECDLGHHPESPQAEGPAGRGLALPAMESTETGHGTQCQETVGRSRCLEDPGGAHRLPDLHSDHHEVPGLKDHPGQCRHPLADADQPPMQRGLAADGGPQSVLDLDSDWMQLQTTFPDTVQAGGGFDSSSVPTTLQGSLQGQQGPQGLCEGPTRQQRRRLTPSRDALCAWMMRVSFLNSDSQCYFNSALAAWFWAHLSLQDWRPSFLGDAAQCLLGELGAATDTFDWGTSTWLAPLLRRWGLTGRQADSAEFSQMLLSYTEATHLTQFWQKRRESDGILIHEHFVHLDLIRLLFPDDPFHTSDTIELTALFEHWVQDDGMRAALISAPSLMCVHLSRYANDEDNRMFPVRLTVQTADGVQVPWFPNPDSLHIDWHHMEVISMICHLGVNHTSGHYRAALRCRNEDNEFAWLLTEDNCPPQLVATLPNWHHCWTLP
eukprot:Skav222316  [mRNA]  locus=scaffold1249:215100:218544:- [translate_table: standard]